MPRANPKYSFDNLHRLYPVPTNELRGSDNAATHRHETKKQFHNS